MQSLTGYGNGDTSRYTDFCYSYYATPNSNACLDVAGSGTTNSSSSTNRVTRRSDALSGVSTAYSYDYAGRLLTATASSGYTYTYTYDADGNRTSQTAGSTTTDYGYNSGNQLCWTRTRGLLPEPAHTCPAPLLATAYNYDTDGNQRQPGNLSYNGSDQTTSFNGPLAGYLGSTQNERYSLGSTVYNTSMLGLTNSKTGTAGTVTYDRASDGTLVALHIPATGSTPARTTTTSPTTSAAWSPSSTPTAPTAPATPTTPTAQSRRSPAPTRQPPTPTPSATPAPNTTPPAGCSTSASATTTPDSAASPNKTASRPSATPAAATATPRQGTTRSTTLTLEGRASRPRSDGL